MFENKTFQKIYMRVKRVESPWRSLDFLERLKGMATSPSKNLSREIQQMYKHSKQEVRKD